MIKFMHGCFSGLILLVSLAYAETDAEWLGLDSRPYRLEVNYGQYEHDENNWGAALSLPGPRYSEISASYTEYSVRTVEILNTPQAQSRIEIVEGEQQLAAWSIAWASDPYANWGFDLRHSFKGKSNALEVTESGFGLSRGNSKWRGGFHYYSGKVKGYSRELVFERFDVPESASVDKSGIGFALQRMASSWSWYMDARHFDYSRDLSNALESRLFLLTFNDAIISQVLLLNNWEVDVGVNWQMNDTGLQAGVEVFEDVVDATEDSLLYSNLEIALTPLMSVGFGLSHFVNESTTQGSVALVFQW